VSDTTTVYTDGNDQEFEYELDQKNASTGLAEAATGLSGLTCHYAATKTGATIDASLSVSASERGSTGRYYGVHQGSDLTTYLAAYVGKRVFRVLAKGTDIHAYTTVTVKAAQEAAV